MLPRISSGVPVAIVTPSAMTTTRFRDLQGHVHVMFDEEQRHVLLQ